MRGAVRFYFIQFLCNFGRHIPLVLAVGFVFALIFVPEINQSFGIRNLLWHEDDLKQGAVGFALGVVIVQALLAGYLLETQRTGPADRPCIQRLGPAMTYGLGVLASMIVTIAPVLIGLGAFWKTILAGWPLGVGFLLAMCIYLLGLRLLPREGERDTWISKLGQKLFKGMAHIKLLRVPKAREVDMAVHGVAMLATAFSMVVYIVVGAGPLGLFSPFVGVFALLGVGVSLYGFVEYFLDRVQPVMILSLIGFVYMGGVSPFALRFPDLGHLYSKPINLDDYNPIAETDLLPAEAVDFCGEARGPYLAGQKRPLVVICVSGGGIRAAAWTTAVLHKLERSFANLIHNGKPLPIDFPCHVRVITGASGGMVGAGYYVANLPNPPASPLDRRDLYRHYEAMTSDCLTPIVHAMSYHDLRSVFSPFGHPRDRGQALESAWTENLKDALDQTFDRLREGEKSGWRPSLIFSPMLVEEGRRLLISNLDLRGVASNDGTILQESRDAQTDPSLPIRKYLNRFSFESYEFFRLFSQPEVRKSFRVATAARMSASFPYVSPAPTLPTQPRRRVVDAGYYDNDGVSLAASWLFSGSNRDWLRKHVSKIVLIQIRDGSSERERKLQCALPDTTSALTRGLEFVSTPPTALFSARVGSSTFRNDGLLEILSQQLITELQLRPLLKELADDEIALLSRAKERDTAVGMIAHLSQDSAKMRDLRQALAEKEAANDAQRDRIEDYGVMVDNAAYSSADRKKWSRTMTGLRFDAKPDQWVNRLLREGELHAASFQMSPDDESELLNKFARRLKDANKAADLMQRVKLTFDRELGAPFFVTLALEYDGEASLSWYLTARERRDILATADELDSRIELLQQWWLAPAAQDGMVGRR